MKKGILFCAKETPHKKFIIFNLQVVTSPEFCKETSVTHHIIIQGVMYKKARNPLTG